MSDRIRSLFYLFLIAVMAVGGNVLLSFRPRPAAALQDRSLLDGSFEPRTIVFARPDAESVVLEYDGVWMLREPYAASADARLVLRLLDALTVTQVGDAISEHELRLLGRSREDFGLEKPCLTLTFIGSESSRTISFGQMTAASNAVYAVVADSDAVLTVPKDVFSAANLSADALRERNVFPFDTTYVSGFDLKLPDASQKTFLRTVGGWTVGDCVASARKVDEFLARIAQADAYDFVWPIGASNETGTASASLLSAYGLDAESALTLNLRCVDGIDRRILFGRAVGEHRVYALVHNASAIVTIDESLKEAALEGSESFADARLFPVDELSISSFVVSDGDLSCVVARTHDGWRLDSPVSAPADERLAKSLVSRLVALTADDLTEADSLRVTVSTNFPSYRVSRSSLLGSDRLDDLRSREILKIDSSRVRRLVSQPGPEYPRGMVAIVHSFDRKGWTIESGAVEGSAVNETVVKNLLEAISSLNALTIVRLRPTTADLIRYGLEKPCFTLAIDQEREGAVRRNILIGDVAPGGRYATVGSSDAIFILPRETVEYLTCPLTVE